MISTVKPIHRLAAVELLYRATRRRRPLCDDCFDDLKHDFAALLAEGRVVGMRAKCFGGEWEFMMIAGPRKVAK